MKKILLIFFLFLFQFASAQYLEQYETDDYAEYGKINGHVVENGYIYIFGKAHDHGDDTQPHIRKIDSLGNIVWTTTDNDNDVSSLEIYETHLSSDGYLYSLISGQLWKVDTLTGDIIYKYDFDPGMAQIKNLTDFNGDTLLFVFENGYNNGYLFKLAFFDKVQGALLSFSDLLVSTREFDYTLSEDNETIFYSKNDTIYRSTPTNIGSYTWKTPVINSSGPIDFKKLHYDEENDVLYGIGDEELFADDGFVCKLNAQTGNILWTLKPETNDDVKYRGHVFEGNYLYINWKHSTTGGGTYHVVVDKINLSTGSITWEIEGEYEDGNEVEQAALDMAIDASGIYLTGYYNANNSGPGTWGVMKLNKSNGSKIFSTRISNEDNNQSQGMALAPLSSKFVCVGNIGSNTLFSELFVELNKFDGTITNRKDVGGNAFLPSVTVDIDQRSNGEIIVLQQKGRYGHLSIRDVQGNIQWDSLLFIFPDHGVSYLDVVSDSVALIGHVQGNNSFYISFFNPMTRKIEEIAYHSPQNGDRKIIDIIYKHGEKMYVSTLDYAGEVNIYRFYNSGTSWHLTTDEYHTTITNPFADVFIDMSPSQVVILRSNIWLALHYQTLMWQSGQSAPGYSQYAHPGIIQDSLIVFTGVSDNGNLSILRVNRNSLNLSSAKEIIGLQTTGVKWIKGENSSTIYALSENGDDVYVTKFDIDNQNVIWSSTISSGNSSFPLINATDIGYNSTEEYITVTGYRETIAGDNKQFFYSLLLNDGTVIADVTRNGDFPGENQGLTILSHNNSGTTLIGGQINKDTLISSALLFYINESNFINPIKGKVFLDEDNNGIQNDNEPNISVGNVSIDNEYDTYLNANGLFQTIPNPGWHSVTYNLPTNWSLTSDSLTFHLDTNDPIAVNDTLCFGIKPDNEIDRVEPFIFTQPLVCNIEIPFLLQIKNTGTTVQDIVAKIKFDGYFVDAVPNPDSIGINSLYWPFNEIRPGESKIVQLIFQMPGIMEIGETLHFNAYSYLYDSDQQIFIDTFDYKYQDILLCSYDPNDKHAIPVGVGDDGLTLFDNYLNYTIRFQNTGNYPAKDIVIIDTLDTDLDMSTFEFLTASHPITDIKRTGNVMEFVFQNIFLPDSLSNEPESHGFVSFRIKPKEGLPENTMIFNKAYIYFDLNPAIITNITKNTLVSDLTSVDQVSINKNALYKVFPNPSLGEIFIESLHSLPIPISWQLFDLLGRRIDSGLIGINENKLDIRSLNNGVYFLEINQKAVFKVILSK